MEEIESRLHELADILERSPLRADMRGDGASRFLYVVGNGRSAEVSLHSDKFWVEFWNSLDENAQAVAEAMFDSVREVEEALLERLI